MPGASAADGLDPGDEPVGAVTLDRLHPAGEQPVTRDGWSQAHLNRRLPFTQSSGGCGPDREWWSPSQLGEVTLVGAVSVQLLSADQ